MKLISSVRFHFNNFISILGVRYITIFLIINSQVAKKEKKYSMASRKIKIKISFEICKANNNRRSITDNSPIRLWLTRSKTFQQHYKSSLQKYLRDLNGENHLRELLHRWVGHSYTEMTAVDTGSLCGRLFSSIEVQIAR